MTSTTTPDAASSETIERDPLLQVERLRVEYGVRARRRFAAVSDVSFDIHRGETLGLVGESGCGKSSTGRAILHLPPPTAGTVRLAGDDLTAMSRRDLRRARRRVQMIFQDPYSSLNPRRTVAELVADGLELWRMDDRTSRVRDALHAVGLDPDSLGDRRPHQLSGGQCQRVCIARAIALEPDLLVCDEVVSALDVSVQAQVLNVFAALKRRYGLTMLFISHDLAVVKNVSDRIAVMYLGRICEIGPARRFGANPRHPYTAALLRSIPIADPDVALEPAHAVPGDLPSPHDPPSGCRFRTRCPFATERCADEEPALRELEPGQFVACHFPLPGGASS